MYLKITWILWGGKVKTNEYPQHIILIFSAQNLSLLNNSYIAFTRGYIRTPLILVRVIVEQLILSMYFWEFPDKEIEYRTTNYRDFFRNNKIDQMLKKVEKEGKTFKKPANQKGNYYHKLLYENVYEQASYFLHNNYNVLNNMMYDEKYGAYTKGPKLHNQESLNSVLYTLLLSCLYANIVMGVTFKIQPSEKDIEITEHAVTIIEKLAENSKSKKLL